jgi:hypothetical protein
MRAIVSTLFHVVRFPHQGKVVTIDQLAFFNSDTHTGNMSFIAKTPPGYENVGVGLLKDSSLMGTFPIPPPDVPRPSVASINMISTISHELPASHDPWIVPDPGDHLRFDDVMSLSPVESAYQAIQSATPSTSSLDELSPDPFRVIFPTDEMIMSVMGGTPWNDGHHHSRLFLEQHTLEHYRWIPTPSTFVVIPVVSIDPFTKGGIALMACHPHSVGGHGYVIVAVDHFTKWAEVMPTVDNTGIPLSEPRNGLYLKKYYA